MPAQTASKEYTCSVPYKALHLSPSDALFLNTSRKSLILPIPPENAQPLNSKCHSNVQTNLTMNSHSNQQNKQDGLQLLVQALNEKLGPCSGIDSDDVDAAELQDLMRNYIADETEWAKYYFPSPNMAYTRNLVDKGNGKSNLLILVWTPGKGSLIHDHANAHCIMKVLKGKLVETRFAWPTVALNNSTDCPMQKTVENTYEENEVTYMSDKLGLHSIRNPSPDEHAVSLHLYTPPNAAVYGCNIFNEQTGQASHTKKCAIFSAYGNALRETRP